MKSGRLNWFFVSLLVLITVAVLSGKFQNYAQQQTSKPKPTPKPKKWDLDKYPVVDYNAPEPTDPEERQKKKEKGKRYDNMNFVSAEPHPEYGLVYIYDYSPQPPMFPVNESDLVVIGEIISGNASTSNDKKGIYSEYNVRTLEALKLDSSHQEKSKGSISVDRAGGYVRYPNGQKVLYLVSGQDLPKVGQRYLLFLTNKEKRHNYRILTGYELNQDSVIPLDSIPFDDFEGLSAQNFIETVRYKINASIK